MLIVMNKLKKQKGYSLIELVIALLISSILVLGMSTAFNSISGLIQSSKNIENAQEVYRFSTEVFTRSLKKYSDKTRVVDDGSEFNGLTVGVNTLSIWQRANTIACDGSLRTSIYTESYSLVNNNLQCKIDIEGAAEGTANTILTGVESINFSQSGNLVSVLIQPLALNGEAAGVGATKARTIDVALSEIIMSNITGENTNE